MSRTFLYVCAALTACITVGGCAGSPSRARDSSRAEVPVSQASLPSVIRPYQQIDQALACIKSTHVIDNRTFVVGPFADSTGKINSVATGSTGAFVPQGGSAAYITDALTKAGGRVVSTYFGTPAISAPAQYMVNGIFNSLDFGTTFTADVQAAGIGPVVQFGWAQLTLSIQLDEAGTRINRQMSMIQRPVRYSQLGVSTGTVFGNTLITGNVSAQNQERLQFEALNGPIALGIVDILTKEFPVARSQCGEMVADLLAPAWNAAEPQAPKAGVTGKRAPAEPLRRTAATN